MREYRRYRIDWQSPGGTWATYWDAMAFTARQAVDSIRGQPAADAARKHGYRFRAVPEAGRLFGT